MGGFRFCEMQAAKLKHGGKTKRKLPPGAGAGCDSRITEGTVVTMALEVHQTKTTSWDPKKLDFLKKL